MRRAKCREANLLNTASASLAHGEHEEMLRVPKTAPSGSHILQGTPPMLGLGEKQNLGRKGQHKRPLSAGWVDTAKRQKKMLRWHL